jgi:endonuclease YncB( thermonuclease family)
LIRYGPGHRRLICFGRIVSDGAVSRFWVSILSSLVVAFGVAADRAAGAASEIAGQASVIDGDTLDIHGIRLRLYGIDAPEGRQLCQDATGRDYRCGQRAANLLADKIGRQTVRCDPRDTDRYGRTVAVCRAGGVDLGGWLVRAGWAVAYERYSKNYVADQDDADAARRGIWAGSFLRPEEWRRSKATQQADARAPSAPVTPQACLIKGNISQNTGDRIYHVPGGLFYEQTVVSPSRGERWFCSEAEALAAGWRRSRQ